MGVQAQGKKEMKSLLTRPASLSRWGKLGSGGTEDETVKHRVAGPHYWGSALSEPDVTVSRHPAQALRTPLSGRRSGDTKRRWRCTRSWHSGWSRTRFSTLVEPPITRGTR